MMQATRREFLRRASALSVLTPGAGSLAVGLAAMGNAAAAVGDDYKALVCVFLQGGNDAFNMVLPTDVASWSAYTSVRNQAPDPIALKPVGTAKVATAAIGSPDRLGGVSPLSLVVDHPGRTFAVHPCLDGLVPLFNTARRLAIVANVGPLIQPTTKSDYRSASFPKPPKLFSHNDQQATWQALAPEGAARGWGGLMADLMLGGNGAASTFTSISASGSAVWLAGQQVLPYQVSGSGAIKMGVDGAGKVYNSLAVAQAMSTVVKGGRSSHLMHGDYAAVAARSISAEATLTAALPSARVAPYGSPGTAADPLLNYTTVTGSTAVNSLAAQLQIVSRMISAGKALGLRRQIFFVALGSFDSHDLQNRNQADLFLRMTHGLSYFDSVLGALNLLPNVTTFTASDFGRTFTSNGDGTDHGWGGHHLVMGGAVRGGNIVGTFPTYAPNDGRNNFASPDQLDGNGAMIPTTSVEQYAAALGKWFGVPDSALLSILPRLVNWDAGKRVLQLMA